MYHFHLALRKYSNNLKTNKKTAKKILWHILENSRLRLETIYGLLFT